MTLPEYDEAISAVCKENEKLEAENERLRADCKEKQRLIERLDAVIDRAAGDRSYDGDLIDDLRDIIDGRTKTALKGG